MKLFAVSLWGLLALVALSQCSTSPNIAAVNPYAAAPAPSPGGYVQPPSGVPPVAYPFAGGTNSFYPTLPTGFPPNFTPFLPFYNVMQSTPVLQTYWMQIWGGWQNFAGMQGIDPFNFAAFWTLFLPQAMPQPLVPVFSYVNFYFYFWVTPQTQFAPNLSPLGFWQNYIGLPWGPLGQSCMSCGF